MLFEGVFLIMETLIINSPKHGSFKIFVDKEDLDRLSSHTWHIYKGASGKVYIQGRLKNSHKYQKKVKIHRFLMNLTDLI